MAQAESQGGGGAQEIEGEAGKIFSGQPIHSCHKRLVVSNLMTFLHRITFLKENLVLL